MHLQPESSFAHGPATPYVKVLLRDKFSQSGYSGMHFAIAAKPSACLDRYFFPDSKSPNCLVPPRIIKNNTPVLSPRLLRPLGLCLYGYTLLSSVPLAWGSSPSGLNQPEPVGAYFNGTFPNSAPGDPSGWAVENAFPNLTFTDPMMFAEIPGRNEFLVVGKTGQIWRFPKNSAATMEQRVVVADLTGRVETSEDQGFYSLAFHPQFAQSGAPGENKVYVCYNRRAFTGVDDNDRTYWTVSQFNWVPATGTLDTSAENILISQYDPHRFHNGGASFFGTDGFLYITAGDGGLGADALDNSQRIDVGFFGGILRIDVDNNPAKSHPIRRQPTEDPLWEVNVRPPEWPASYSQGYGIPNDNPFLDAGGGKLEEFYAIGLRSPHSAHLDPVVGDIWVGDVGEAAREELDRVSKGANLQWAYVEGTKTTSKNKPSPLTGYDVPPVYEYTHAEGSSIIGGMRYRGAKWASFLEGKVIFGDHVRGRIWSLEPAEISGPPTVHEMMSSFDTGYKKGLCGFFTDSAGEIYITNLGGANSPNGKIMKLALPAISAEPPHLLSQTGVFTNLATFATAPGVIPYDVPNPLWSDAAAKKRWIILPNNGTFNSAAEDIIFNPEGSWVFPPGTVFVKHFETNTNANNPAAIKRLETRFLICTAGGGKYGVTYKWNEAGTDAELMAQGEEEAYSYTKSNGSTEQRTWSFPSRGDCMVCHNDTSGQALGFRTSNLNSSFHYPSTGRTANQLETFNSLGAFSVTLSAAQLESYIEARPLDDETAPLEHRVRSYMDTNCSHCHQPGGAGDGFDARLGTPLDLQNLINGIPQRFESLGPDGRYISPGNTSLSAVFVRASAVDNGDAMPPLAKHLAHAGGIAALQSYISGLNPAEFEYLPAPKARFVKLKTLSGTRGYASVREFEILDGEGVKIPVDQLSIHDFDAQDGLTTAVTSVIDGRFGSSNQWQTPNVPGAAHPHFVTIDLGSLREFGGYNYYPRFNSTNGRVANFEVYYSTNGTTWTLFNSGTWPTSSAWPINVMDHITYSPPYNKRAARCQLGGPVTAVEGSFDATVVFDMDVTDFDASDITVQNGTVTGLRGSGYYYVARISPAPHATNVNVSVAADVVSPEGQGSRASQPVAVTILPDVEAPTTPANFTGEPGSFTVALSWSASTDKFGVAGYEVRRDGDLIATVITPGYTDNSVDLQTQYHYEVVAFDGVGNVSQAAGLTLTTLGDAEPPSVPENLNSVPGLFAIQLTWDPSSDNMGVADYEVWRDGSLLATVASPGYTDNDLLIDTAYHYTVIALDGVGNASEGAMLTARTLADTQAPTIPGSLAATPGLISVQLSWQASTDNVAVTEYEVRRNGSPIAIIQGLTYTDNDLLPDTGYTYQVRAHDSSGNYSASAHVATTTLTDQQAPVVPTGLFAEPDVQTVQLSWQASTDNLGVTGYEVRRDGALIATVPAPGFLDSGLLPETSYSYEVVALDAAGNASLAASVSTGTLADDEPPAAPGGLTAVPDYQSVALSWTAASDNVAVTGYRVLRGGNTIATVSGLSYTDSGLERDTGYAYQVRALDATGNLSEPASLNVHTLGFEDWLDDNELEGQNAADSDHGGLDNLTEYYLGMNPNDPQDDLTFRLVCQPQGATFRITYPDLKPAGNYYLHRSNNLTDIRNVAHRINTLTRAQIQAMTPAERVGHVFEVPDPGTRDFFILIFEPPVSE